MSKTPYQSGTISVYYDGACGLCSKEIHYYQHIARDKPFDWQDIARDASSFEAKGYRKVDGLKLLHAQKLGEPMRIGVDAFILIWKHLPHRGWNALGVLTGLPIIRHIAQFAYRRFATWRFNRLEHCQLALKEDAS